MKIEFIRPEGGEEYPKDATDITDELKKRKIALYDYERIGEYLSERFYCDYAGDWREESEEPVIIYDDGKDVARIDVWWEMDVRHCAKVEEKK